MSRYDALLKSPVKVLKHNGKVRTLEGNERYVLKINAAIDEMYEYMPANQYASHIRRELTQYKKYFKEDALHTGQVITATTTFGEVKILSKPKTLGSNRDLTFSALNRIGMLDIFDLDQNKYVKNYIFVDTTGVKLDKNTTRDFGKLNQLHEHHLQSCYVETDDNPLTMETESIVKMIAAKTNVLKMIREDSRKYTGAYNKLKQLYNEATDPTKKHANFPTNYVYRGVMIGWSSLTYSMPLSSMVNLFLRNYDIKNSTTFSGRFKKAITEIVSEKNEYAIHLLLDEIDYEFETEQYVEC